MKKLFYISFLSVPFFMFSCKTEKITTTAPEPTTTVTGFINAYNEHRGVTAKDSIKIVIDGTDKSAVTNANGKFNLLNIAEGNYKYTVSKNGFDNVKGTFTVPIASGNAPYNLGNYLSINALSSTVLTTVTSVFTYPTSLSGFYGDTTLDIHAGFVLSSSQTISGNNFSKGAVIFLDTTAQVSKSKYFTVASSSTYFPFSEVEITISIQSLKSNYKLKKGTMVYVLVYGSSSNTSTYYDVENGVSVYVGLNPKASSVMSVIIP
jgi:hypothetical protein